MLLSDDSLLNYLRCQRRSFLEANGDLQQRESPGDYLGKILVDSASNRKAVLAQAPYEQPAHTPKDRQGGLASTRDLMRRGVERIHQAQIAIPGPEGTTLTIQPDLLLKQPGQSEFGDWLYEVAQIKLSRRPKLEYQLIATFQTWVLSQFQSGWPEQAWLFLRDRDPYVVNLAERWSQMEEVVQGWVTMMTSRSEPEVFIARSRCSMCGWYQYCHDIATAQQHLSLLPGVTPRRYVFLREKQLTTLEALHATDPHELAQLPGFGPEVAQKLIDQARSMLTNRPIRPRHIPPAPTLQAPVELYFDIEAEPDLGLAYLHGVLVVDHDRHSETFHPFLAESPAEEPQVWAEFIDLVCQRYPEAPVYHFCSYEADTVRRLGQIHGEDPHQLDALLKRFVDIHYWVTQTAIMPVESYALKNIARWLGFEWRDDVANGAQAVYWYSQWLTTGDRHYLDRILVYNEDDCRATYIVKEWLAEFIWGLQRETQASA